MWTEKVKYEIEKVAKNINDYYETEKVYDIMLIIN